LPSPKSGAWNHTGQVTLSARRMYTLLRLIAPLHQLIAQLVSRHVVLAGLASAFAIIAFGYALQRSDVVIVSPIVSINPLITLLLAQVFLPGLERVTKQVVVGTLLTVAGVVLVIMGSTM